MLLLLIPVVIQGVIMLVDEFYFHQQRGLGLWERRGHPIDTFSVFVCYLFLVLKEPSDFNLKLYTGLCLLSCLLITKDEFVHTGQCTSMENWLHSLLFVLHPITLLAAGVIWHQRNNLWFLNIQLVVLFIFMFYQFFYWRFFAKNK